MTPLHAAILALLVAAGVLGVILCWRRLAAEDAAMTSADKAERWRDDQW